MRAEILAAASLPEGADRFVTLSAPCGSRNGTDSATTTCSSSGQESARRSRPELVRATLRLPLRRRLGRGPRGDFGLDGARAEIVIWNPDGSTAELSGNGTRIAARWLARRDGADEVTIAVGPAGGHARRCGAASRSRWTWGRVEVAPIGAARRDGTRARVHAGLGRQPARGHRAATPSASELLRLGPARREPSALPRAHERAARPRRLARATRPPASGSAARGRRSRPARAPAPSQGAAVANGWCDSPVTVHLAGGDLLVELDEQHARAPDRARRRRSAPASVAEEWLGRMKFARRLDLVPPYLFAELERKIDEKRASRRRRHQPRDRRSRTCRRPAPVVEACSSAAADPGDAPVPVEPRPGALSARRSPTSTRIASASTIDPGTEVVPVLGGKEGVAHIAFACLDPGDVCLSPEPGYPPYTSGPLFAGAEVALPAAPRGATASCPTSTAFPRSPRAARTCSS